MKPMFMLLFFSLIGCEIAWTRRREAHNLLMTRDGLGNLGVRERILGYDWLIGEEPMYLWKGHLVIHTSTQTSNIEAMIYMNTEGKQHPW